MGALRAAPALLLLELLAVPSVLAPAAAWVLPLVPPLLLALVPALVLLLREPPLLAVCAPPRLPGACCCACCWVARQPALWPESQCCFWPACASQKLTTHNQWLFAGAKGQP